MQRKWNLSIIVCRWWKRQEIIVLYVPTFVIKIVKNAVYSHFAIDGYKLCEQLVTFMFLSVNCDNIENDRY